MKLAKHYTPNDFEPTIYAMWETAGVFAPKGEGRPYSIVMPPPNANGDLHIGHALDMNLKDIIARWRRMKGDDVAFIPGADHAGFETWVVYERKLGAEGKSRLDFTRDELYQQVRDFVEEKRGNMELQLRALGTSASWDDLVFTLDPKVIDTVYDTFKQLWDEGLIYRGERIVNYSTKYQTSYADIEVDHKTEKGTLWKIAYPTLDSVGEIVVATTRPETMLGDTAVAVHPEDERYKHLIGTRVLLPIIGREIPVVADEYVDREFGTGAVKITPAHDPNDFELGQRHDLERLQVIGFDGKMTNVPPQFAGLPVLDARKVVLATLKAEELLRGEETIEHTVGYDYKSGELIQPLIKDQWFLQVKPLVEKAKTALEAGEITFYPASKKRQLTQYYDNLRDWNLSRQIPWGIPIPMFQSVDNPEDWIFDKRVEEKEIVVNGTTYRREEDTFDTWFSSGQWPFIVTDYLDGGDLSRFFPTSLMETGSDLLRQWVARMVMLSLYRTGKVPFETVYFHGMVNDEHNQKMSKSKGNVINPMEMIAEYGSDALRMGIITGRAPAQAQAFNRGAVIAGRNFCNKLWNIARLVEHMAEGVSTAKQPDPQSMADHWIISRLDEARNTIDAQLSDYRFSEASEAVYHAIWDDVADWYIETAKVEQNTDMLVWVLDTALKLAHPFAPFVTETIWQTLGWHEDIHDMAITARWPEEVAYDEIAAAQFERLKLLVEEARFVTAQLPGNHKYTLLYADDSLVEDNEALIAKLVRDIAKLEKVDEGRGLRLAASGRDVWLDISEEVLYEHQTNLERRLAEVRSTIASLEARLSNESYTAKAPAHLVEESRDKLKSEKAHEEELVAQLATIVG